MENAPIIRMEIQRMKHTMVTVLTEYQAKIDEDIRKAVEQYCTDDNIADLVNRYARDVIDSVVKEEVDKYFRYGTGRTTVTDQVRKMLKNEGGE